MSSESYAFSIAAAEQAQDLTVLINAAFAIESTIFSDERIDLIGVLGHLQKGTFIVARRCNSADHKLVGCVYIESQNELGYFGLLSVAPSEQRHGLGAQLISEAEDLCGKAGAKSMYIRTINLRAELPPYYRKFGYSIIREEFPEQGPSAIQPYHYVIMEKELTR